MKHVNRISLVGRLTMDPELRTLQSGKCMTIFRMATNDYWKDVAGEWKQSADYHRVVAWNGMAERINAVLKKGDMVLVEGKVRTRGWTAKDGTKRSSTEIALSTVAGLIPIDPVNEPLAAENVEASTEELETIEL